MMIKPILYKGDHSLVPFILKQPSQNRLIEELRKKGFSFFTFRAIPKKPLLNPLHENYDFMVSKDNKVIFCIKIHGLKSERVHIYEKEFKASFKISWEAEKFRLKGFSNKLK